MGALRDYLRQEVEIVSRIRQGDSSWHYVSPADLILREGRDWRAETYNEDDWGPRGLPRQCFKNAYHLALEFPDDLVYVEGYAYRDILAVQHAWAVETFSGNVVDPTWDNVAADAGFEYLGIPFDFDWVEETTTARGYYGVIDDWQRHFPLLRGPLDPGIVAEAFRELNAYPPAEG